VNKLALAIPSLLAATWILLMLGSFMASFIFAAYMAGIAASIASARNNLVYATTAAVISLSTLSILSKMFAVDVVYAVVASLAMLIRGAVDEKGRVFNFVITAAIAIALVPYTQAMLSSIYRI